jgi:hypothetical protein
MVASYVRERERISHLHDVSHIEQHGANRMVLFHFDEHDLGLSFRRTFSSFRCYGTPGRVSHSCKNRARRARGRGSRRRPK